ncbi:MAG TPA: SIS domain-containing protein [Terriglobales bacterium]|jgi:D-sedoheptulose 7-phosphate isomerase|nr:SIS domain-containing protein [Terriglobales bacterium]
MQTALNSYFDDVIQTIGKMPIATIEKIVTALREAYESSRTIYLFGNGGSAALASHFACDLGKGASNGSSKRFQALAFTDNVPMMTAWANDARYEDIFAEQLINFVRRDDIAFAISGSGNSPNVLKALKVAREAGAFTIGLTGFQGGDMKDLCDLCLTVPSENMQIIEDLHLSVTHAVFTALRAKISRPDDEAVA